MSMLCGTSRRPEATGLAGRRRIQTGSSRFFKPLVPTASSQSAKKIVRTPCCGLPATSRKEPDRVEAGPTGKVPIDRLAQLAPTCRISRARVVDAGRVITGGELYRSDVEGWRSNVLV
jgi:hypothetical protein